MSNMEYLVAHMTNNPLKSYQEKIAQGIFEEFGIKNNCQKIPPHLTLKAPFTRDEIDDVEKALEKTVKRFRISPHYTVGELSHFDKEVIALEIKVPPAINAYTEDVRKALKKIEGIEFLEFDKRDINYHATLCYTDEGNFEKVFSYVKEKGEQPTDTSIGFDNIAIFKRESKNPWRVHKRFNF